MRSITELVEAYGKAAAEAAWLHEHNGITPTGTLLFLVDEDAIALKEMARRMDKPADEVLRELGMILIHNFVNGKKFSIPEPLDYLKAEPEPFTIPSSPKLRETTEPKSEEPSNAPETPAGEPSDTKPVKAAKKSRTKKPVDKGGS